MATTGIQNQERVAESLKKQLALAVRRIQWSYAIFWTISATQPGILEWGEGYYNGDIKTRKTIQAVELNYDELDLQRSEQLRELYESLSAGESNPQASIRHTAALSPEDLTDTEWYYLVCMSFVFNIGEGLPGKTLAKGQPIWLCNAHYADSKVFSRSLLAKSASVQTVVCFPFLKGVVEFGVTELVLEEPGLIQHIKTSLLEIPYPMISIKSIGGAGNVSNDKDLACAAPGSQILDDTMVPVVGCEVLEMASPGKSLNDIEHNQPAADSFMVQGINGVASQVQSWQFMDDEFSNNAHHSMNSGDCISQTFVDAAKVVTASKDDKTIDHCLQEFQEYNHTKLYPQGGDLHYQSVLSSLLKPSHQLTLGPDFRNCNKGSIFISWKKGGLENCKKQREGVSQKILKKILFEVPRMNCSRFHESPEYNCKDDAWRPDTDEIAANHVLSERKKRKKLNQSFFVLKSMVPSINKFDKISILDDTIEYLKGLERKVQKLESCGAKLEAETGGKSKNVVERTSDNSDKIKTSYAKKPLVNKRKARDIDVIESELDNISVIMNEKDVQIEIVCPWRERILLEIMEAICNLHLDSHSVQSSTNQGILSLTIKTKYKGSNVPSAGMIKQSLQRVAWKF